MTAIVGATLHAQTQIDLRTQSKHIDFSKAQSTKPVKTVTVLPAACASGEMAIVSSAPAGQNLAVCVATNTWAIQNSGLPTAQSTPGTLLSTDLDGTVRWTAPAGDVSDFGSSTRVTGLQNRTVAETAPQDREGLIWNATLQQWEPGAVASQGQMLELEGSAIGAAEVQNYIAGYGVTAAITSDQSRVNIEHGVNTAVMQTRASAQAGTSLLCVATTGAPDSRCSMMPPLASYATGMVVHWVPAANSGGTAMTLNVDEIGAAPVKAADGVSNPLPAAVAAGRLYSLWFDGAVFRLPAHTYDKASWGLCAGQNCAVNDAVAVPYIAVASLSFAKCHIAAGTAPTGSDIVVDVLKNGASIFGAAKLVLTQGQVSGSSSAFSATGLAEGDLLTAIVQQIGSVEPGKDLAVSCRLER